MDHASDVVVYHHLGLGDHIICNGMVRSLLDTHRPGRLWLITKQSNLRNVRQMYLDEPRISFIPVVTDNDVAQLRIDWSRVGLVRAGFERSRLPDWDAALYDAAGVPFTDSWSRFAVARNEAAERRLVAAIDPPAEFALVHGVGSSGVVEMAVRTDLPIISVERHPDERTMLDWIPLIERAAEVHCINSSFLFLVDRVAPVRQQRLHFHRARVEYRAHDGFSVRKAWTVHDPLAGTDGADRLAPVVIRQDRW